MEIEDRLKMYLSFADVSRRWTSVMDAKAAFLSALNGGLLAFLWGGAKLADWSAIEKTIGSGATLIALLGLLSALWAISPREKLSLLVGKKSRWQADYKPVSFYGYIAKKYRKNEFDKMEADLAKMDDAQFAHEALEQHFNISRVIQTKSEWVFRTVMLTFLAILLAGVALLIKTAG
jgi:hypothetical protein